MLVLNWDAAHECKKHIKAPGLNAKIHMVRGSSFQFPESVEKIVRKQFADALTCKYCTIEKLPEKSGYQRKIESPAMTEDKE